MVNHSSGERLDFVSFNNVTVEHLHRYAVAKELVENKIVLDIASGEGYGSSLLADVAQCVKGVDIDEGTVTRAKEKYKKQNLEFYQGNAANIPFNADYFDVVVSFETIEHHDKHKKMLEEIKRVLKPEGVLIISSPDKEFYSDKTGFNNKFHIKELYYNEFKILVETYFKNVTFLFQKSYNLSSIIANESNFNNTIVYSGNQEKTNKAPLEPVYNIAVASEAVLPKIQTSVYDGSEITEMLISKKQKDSINKVRGSKSYKIGNFLIKPFFKLKKRNK